jgi:hypothetical protein
MRTESFSAKSLIDLFRRRRIATMQEMKAALGTTVDMTVFRNLRELSYRSSYSHRGTFYTLDAVAEFDERGLWTCRGVHFSRFGSLIDTVAQFVTRSECGSFASELAAELQVQVKEPLLKLVTARRVVREEVSGQYLYCAAEFAKRKEQLRQRRKPATAATVALMRESLAETADEAQAAIILFFSTLNEQQRRLYAGLESLRLGHGGDSRIAALTGLDVHTIAKGRTELLQRDVQIDRVRRPGAGRHALEKKPRTSSRRSTR